MNSIMLYLSQNPLYIRRIVLLVLGFGAVIFLCISNFSSQKNKKIEKKIKESKKQEKVVTPRERTANAIVNVMDINDGYLYTKDGYMIGFIRIGNINVELMSMDELHIVTQRLAMSFEGDRQNFDYFTIPSQVNLDPNKDFLKRKHQETDDIGKRKGINLMLQEMAKLSTSGENFEHQHYIKIWKKIGTNVKDTQNELLVRLGEFRERYMQAGIACEILRDKDIIKMCNLFGNPQQAPFTGSNISRYENFAILKIGEGNG